MDINHLQTNERLNDIDKTIENYGQEIENMNEDISSLNSEVAALEQKCIVKGDFAVLIGEFPTTTLNTNSMEFLYPAGFTQENCVPVAIAVNKNTMENLSFGFCINSSTWVGGAGLNKILLGTDSIQVQTCNPSKDFMMGNSSLTSQYSEDTTLSCKLVLMKIYKESSNPQIEDMDISDLYPIGSVYITSSNTNPSGLLGGQWELFDKEFEPYKNSDESVSSLNSTNTTSATVQVVRQGHTVMIRTEFVPKVALNDSTHDILTFETSTFGAKDNDLYFQRYFVGQTDGGNGLLNIYLTDKGVLSVRDIVTKTENGTIAAGQSCMVTITWEMPWDYMDDNYCNKFYWRRTS